MITPEAVVACHAHHLYYLGPVIDSLAAARVLRSVSAAELTEQPLGYRPKRVRSDDATFTSYAGVWRSLTFAQGGETITDRALVV